MHESRGRGEELHSWEETMSANPTLAQLLGKRLPNDHSRRKFFRLLAAAGLASPLVGGRWAGTAAAAGDPLSTPRKFMDSFYTLNNDYFNEMDQGATQAAAKLNITESREINNAM
jgi:ribose transport system substrate-binding protein